MLHRKALPIFCHNGKSRTLQCWDAIRAAHWLDFGGMDLVCRLTLHEQLYKVLHFGGRQHDQRSRFPPHSEHCVANTFVRRDGTGWAPVGPVGTWQPIKQGQPNFLGSK